MSFVVGDRGMKFIPYSRNPLPVSIDDPGTFGPGHTASQAVDLM
jgi:hypothetical protein